MKVAVAPRDGDDEDTESVEVVSSERNSFRRHASRSNISRNKSDVEIIAAPPKVIISTQHSHSSRQNNLILSPRPGGIF
jgi:hypothetical protein